MSSYQVDSSSKDVRPPASQDTSTTPLLRCPTTDASTCSDIMITLAPPIPAYSPPPFHNAIALSSPDFSQDTDADIVRYNLTYGQRDAGVVRCRSESITGSRGTQYLIPTFGPRVSRESLPPYWENVPPVYNRHDPQHPPREPKTLARTLFRFGFCMCCFIGILPDMTDQVGFCSLASISCLMDLWSLHA